MQIYHVTVILILLITCSTIKQPQVQDSSDTAFSKSSGQNGDLYYRLEIPASSEEEIIHHTGYSFVYSEMYELANWVAYALTKTEVSGTIERSTSFLPDPNVKTGTANNQDYFKSGYDRGHLAPAADMSWSEIAMKESFYYSNIAPQTPAFNRGVWKNLESLVRNWAITDSVLYTVTGPVLTDDLDTIGANKVSVPTHFYKVILVFRKNNAKGIGFIIPNEGTSRGLTEFAISIDSVEQVTGIDFFPRIPDDEEIIIESSICLPCWNW